MLPGGLDRQLLTSLQQRHLAAGAGVNGPAHHPLTPNLLEMAALTQELDTTVRK